jgi:hypothetical protein
MPRSFEAQVMSFEFPGYGLHLGNANMRPLGCFGVFVGKHAVSGVCWGFSAFLVVEKDKRTVPRHVTHRFDQLPLGNLNDTVNSIELSILVRSNRDFDAIKWSPQSRCRHFFGLKSSTSGPWTFTQFFLGIRYFFNIFFFYPFSVLQIIHLLFWEILIFTPIFLLEVVITS